MIAELAIELLKRLITLAEFHILSSTQDKKTSQLNSKIDVYTDGSIRVLGRKSTGGWAAIIVCDGKEPLILDGALSNCSDNNAMELLAVVKALQHLNNKTDEITIYSDSAYVVSTILDGSLQNWQANGWITRKGQQVSNIFYWKMLIPLLTSNVHFKKIPGHSGNLYNELADKVCGDRAKKASFNQPRRR